MRLVLTGPVAAAYPGTEIRLVIARGLRTDEPWPEVDLDAVEDRVAGGWRPSDEGDPAARSWHKAFRAFGTNPRRIRPSVDALGRRLARTGRLPRITPAVDAYNLVSVTYAVPAGAFDLDRLDGDVEIRYAAAGDAFVPLGDPDTVETPDRGEVVYAQGTRILTRHWNHPDADATKVTMASRNVVFILERVDAAAVPSDRLAAAAEKLADLVRPHADRVELATVDQTHLVAELTPVARSGVWPIPRTVTIPRAGDEPTMLTAYLDHYRETIELKCSGVDPARLSERSSPPSTMSLHGLVRHLAGVERWWFAINFAGSDLPMLHYSDDDPEQDFESLDGDPLEALQVWRAECARSRRIVAEAPGLDAVGAVERNGSYTLRWLLLRMIAEYAQHAGHADFLREGIDGATGA